jgi:hypothetical protein
MAILVPIFVGLDLCPDPRHDLRRTGLGGSPSQWSVRDLLRSYLPATTKLGWQRVIHDNTTRRPALTTERTDPRLNQQNNTQYPLPQEYP